MDKSELELIAGIMTNIKRRDCLIGTIEDKILKNPLLLQFYILARREKL